MGKQIIVAIGRESGSGGHYIADSLAERLGIDHYDREILEGAAALGGYSLDFVNKMDEERRNILFNRRLGEHSTAMEDHVAAKTFQFIRREAEAGKSFVVVGRCAEYVLQDCPNMVSIFICGDDMPKIRRTMERKNLNERAAAHYNRATDRQRRKYHDHFCDTEWGDREGYDLIINSGTMGIEHTIDALECYVKEFMEFVANEANED